MIKNLCCVAQSGGTNLVTFSCYGLMQVKTHQQLSVCVNLVRQGHGRMTETCSRCLEHAVGCLWYSCVVTVSDNFYRRQRNCSEQVQTIQGGTLRVVCLEKQKLCKCLCFLKIYLKTCCCTGCSFTCFTILGAFEKSRKAIIHVNFVTPVRPSVCQPALDEFSKICHFSSLRKYVHKIKFSLKADKNNEHVT